MMHILLVIVLLSLFAAPISSKVPNTAEYTRRRTREDPASASSKTQGLEGIAFFMLATTKPFRKISSLESRIVPISQTWASAFEPASVYFVFGTNYYDYSYLQKKCSLRRMEGTDIAPELEALVSGETNESADMPVRNAKTRTRADRHRRSLHPHQAAVPPDRDFGGRRSLRPQTKQRKSEDRRLLYSCDYGYLLPDDHQAGTRPPTFNALFTANCTGEYFGYGPACRYQEAMRFFQYHRRRALDEGEKGSGSLFKNTEWFIFMDDDLYVRPFSLQTLLNTLSLRNRQFVHRHPPDAPLPPLSEVHPVEHKAVHSSQPIAMIQSEMARGFEFSKNWNRTAYNCKVAGVHDIYLSMPAVLNIAAMDMLQAAIDANAVTEAQLLWGGTHDMLAGLLLWMHSIPIFSMGSSYFGGRAFFEHGHTYSYEPRKHIFVHSVKNMQINTLPFVQNNPTGSTVLSLLSMYDVAVSFQDCQAGADSADVCVRYERSNGTHRFSSGGGILDLTVNSPRTEYVATTSYTTREAMIQNQVEMGFRAYKHLLRLPFSYINVTVFAEYAKTISAKFVHFKPEHCVLNKDLVSDSDIERVPGRRWKYKPAALDDSDALPQLGAAFGGGIAKGN